MRKSGSGRSLFLMEVGILLLFFVLSAVVCVSLFAFSNSKNSDANDLNSAVIKAASIADTIKSCKSDTRQAQKILHADDTFHIYYDSDWNTGGGKAYKASVSVSREDLLLRAVITLSREKDNKTIYQLETKEFLGEASK